MAVACGLLLPAPLVVDWGLTNDKVEAEMLLGEAQQNLPGADVLYADAGYDAEWAHRQAHEEWGVATAIPPVKRREGRRVASTARR